MQARRSTWIQRLTFAGAIAALAGCGSLPFSLPGAAVAPTRADLAFAYEQFDRVFASLSFAPAELASVNQAFDQAAFSFFAGNYARTIREVNAVTARIACGSQSTDAARLAGSLCVRLDPPVWLSGASAAATARVASMFDSGLAPGTELSIELQLRRLDGSRAFAVPVSVVISATGLVDQSLSLPSGDGALPVGSYDVWLVAGGSCEFRFGRWFVVDRSLDALRRSNASRLRAVRPSSNSLRHAVALCKQRNDLLRDASSSDNSAIFLADLPGLAADVEAEVAAIELGDNPYHRKTGDHWRRIGGFLSDLPFRVYAPTTAAGDEPLPLVVALHGAGGDENMFFAGYGAGVLRRLAEEKGFIAVTPATFPVLTNTSLFDRLLEHLKVDYAIDPTRVYVVGHSLGGGATVAVAQSRSPTVAAACCIAGGRDFPVGLPVTRLYIGELDPIAPPRNLEAAALRAQNAGVPIEYEILVGYGHTLSVNAALPSAIDWLLERTASGGAASARPRLPAAPRPSGSKLEEAAR